MRALMAKTYGNVVCHNIARGGAARNISLAGVVNKVAHDDKLKEKILAMEASNQAVKRDLGNVSGATPAIDWNKWSSLISQGSVVQDLKVALEQVPKPDRADVSIVEHPVWNESSILGLKKDAENSTASLKQLVVDLNDKIKAIDNMPDVRDMLVEEELAKDPKLDAIIQKTLADEELYGTQEPHLRHSPEMDPRKKTDPYFPNTDVVERINASARAMAQEILAEPTVAAELAKLDPAVALKFSQTIEAHVYQAPLRDVYVENPVHDFSDRVDLVDEVLALQFDGDTDALVTVIPAVKNVMEQRVQLANSEYEAQITA